VGVVAEEQGHHPDLHLESYRNVRVSYLTIISIEDEYTRIGYTNEPHCMIIQVCLEVAQLLVSPKLTLCALGDIQVCIYTHSVGGLTVHDFKLADAIDALPCDYSPKFLEEQTARLAELP